jgi:AbrB family looped-hinge helix DNA binding protein
MTAHLPERMKYYGDTVIGEKGQVVVPAELRRKFGIETGDRFLVMAGERMGAWGLILVKADVLSQIVQNVFGGKLEDVLEMTQRIEEYPHEAPNK